jgi:hypothetical protein
MDIMKENTDILINKYRNLRTQQMRTEVSILIDWHTRNRMHKPIKTDILIDASKEVDLEVNAEIIKYMLLFSSPQLKENLT